MWFIDFAAALWTRRPLGSVTRTPVLRKGVYFYDVPSSHLFGLILHAIMLRYEFAAVIRV